MSIEQRVFEAVCELVADGKTLNVSTISSTASLTRNALYYHVKKYKKSNQKGK
ncbi:MAG: hypothetical protein PHE67_05775 [Campylobacterales bacterium]|nr:hypothetical protein [Campylobacterales bacterium]